MTIEHGASSAVLLTPDEIEPGRRYPLVTVLHGAGRQDELLVRACQGEPEKRQALFLVPRSVQPTWDLIACDERPDLDFLEHAYDLIYRRYPIDPARQALLGYSDGASYALAVGLSNPHVFCAVMGWAAGFVAIDDRRLRAERPEARGPPRVRHARRAVPVRPRRAPDARRRSSSSATRSSSASTRAAATGPRARFQSEALDWFQSEPWEARA